MDKTKIIDKTVRFVFFRRKIRFNCDEIHKLQINDND